MDNKKQDLSKDTVKATEVGFEATASALIIRVNENGEEEFLLNAGRNNPNEAGYGKYALFGVSVTPFEVFEDELAKMLEEQLGIVVKPENMEFNNWFECISSPTKDYLHHAFVIRTWEGTPEVKDPTKSTGCVWVKKSDMPKYLENSFVNLKAHYTNYVNGNSFDPKVNYCYKDYSENPSKIDHAINKKVDYSEQDLAYGAPRTDKKGFTVAVNAIIVKEDGEEEEFCFDFRIAQNKAGYLMNALYGGTATFGERLTHELVRELKEELNIDVNPADVEFCNFFQCIPNAKRHFLHYAFKVTKWSGEMQNMETEKSGGPNWFKKSELSKLKDKFFITWGHLDDLEKGVAHSQENTVNYKELEAETTATKK